MPEAKPTSIMRRNLDDNPFGMDPDVYRSLFVDRDNYVLTMRALEDAVAERARQEFRKNTRWFI
ncbi:MAG: hypothetical protein AAGB11_06755 [Pseudomonadota bacterium]